MRTLQSVIVLALVLLFTTAAQAQTPEQKNLTGRWEGVRQNEGRDNTLALVIDGSAKVITVSVTYNGQEYDVTNVAFSKNVLTFDAVGLSFSGVVTGKTMKFAAISGGSVLWDLTLTKADKR